MPAFSASAPGKIILFGEHAVVYGQPALAVPVQQVRAKAIINAEPRRTPGTVRVRAPDIGMDTWLADLPKDHPLAAVLLKASSALNLHHIPACTLQVKSTIPMAGGMGSSAAISVAVLRAFSAWLGHPFNDEQVSDLAFQVEVLHHGTPSGIDNTVIAYARPVYFVKGSPAQVLQVKQAFTLVIGDTGVQSPTALAVSQVSRSWEADREHFEQLFTAAGAVADSARTAIETGSTDDLGPLMAQNHALLGRMGVSSPELEALVGAANSAGALGAKLSGAGLGGNMIALVRADDASRVAAALETAGARRTIVTEVLAS